MKKRGLSPKRSVSIQPSIKLKEHLTAAKSSPRDTEPFYRTQNHTPAASGGSNKFIAMKSTGGSKQNERTMFRSKRNSYAAAGEGPSRTPGLRFNS